MNLLFLKFRHVRTFLLLALLLQFASIFALNKAAANQQIDEAIELQFWTMQLSPFHDAYIEDVIARFESQHPGVQVKWVDVPWKEMEKKVLASVAAKNPPDVVNLNPQFAAKLAEFNALANPEDHLSEQTISQYQPNVWQANRYQGNIFALPWYLSTTITIVNKKILSDANINEIPTSHAQLLDAAKIIRERLNKYAYFPAMDGSRPLEDMATMGAPLLNEDNSDVGFDNATGLAFFDYYRQLYQQGLIPKSVLTEGHHKAVELFQSGQLAFITTGMQFLNSIRVNAPDIYQHIDIAPQLASAEQKFNIAVMNLAVPKRSNQQKLAFEFAAFVTNHQNQELLITRVPLLTSTAASYDGMSSDSDAAEADTESLEQRARRISAQQVVKGEVLVPPVANYSKLRTSFVRNLQLAMVGAISSQQALDNTVTTWRFYLGEEK